MLLVFSVALIAGCSSSETATQENNDATNKEGGSETTSEVPDRPFVYLAQQVVGTIDPAKHTDETSLQAVINTYDPLVFPMIEKGSMEPGPHVAENWDISEDGKTYTFHLKEGIKFHSGNELTAKDVVFSITRMMAIQKGYSWLWHGILEPENVQAVNDYTVEFTLNGPYAPFVSTLTQLFIVDKDIVLANIEDGEFGEFGDYGQKYLEENIAGSGSYVIDRWERGSELRLSKFPDYWKGWSEGQIEEVRFMIVEEEATVRTMLASGAADMANQWLSVKSFEDLAKEDGIVVKEDPSVQLYHLPINTQRPPFDDINVRKAVLHAFNYETANKQILNGATRAVGPVPILVPGHNPDVTVYQHDIEKAKSYLAQSKYAGQDLTVEFMYINEQPTQRQMGSLLQHSLGEIGIEVELNGVPWAQITESTANVETTPHLVNIFDTLKYPHIDSHTYGIYHPSAYGSYRSSSWYDNPKTKEALENARAAINVEEQMEYYKEAQKLVVEDAVSIYIANPTHRIAFRDYVQGYTYVGLLGYDTAFYYLSTNK
jgi:peptide/nickel transport system substrate-binding protein